MGIEIREDPLGARMMGLNFKNSHDRIMGVFKPSLLPVQGLKEEERVHILGTNSQGVFAMGNRSFKVLYLGAGQSKVPGSLEVQGANRLGF